MAIDEKDVLRIQAPEADLLDGTQPMKVRQTAAATDTFALVHRFPSTRKTYLPSDVYGSQNSSTPGAIRIGMSGLPGVTPTGGTQGGSGTLKASLEGLLLHVNNIVAPQTTEKVFGSVIAPYGEAFAFPTPTTETRMSLCYVDYNTGSSASAISSYGATSLFVASKRTLDTALTDGVIWIRYEYDTGDVIIGFYASASDAENETSLLASATIAEATPGLFPILDALDSETVWAWVHTLDGMTDPGAAVWYDSTRLASAFGVPDARITPKTRIKIPFEFYIGPYWSSSGTIVFQLRTNGIGEFDYYAEFIFDVAGHGAEEGFVSGSITMTCLSEDDGARQIRTWIDLDIGDPALAQIINYQPQMQEGGLPATGAEPTYFFDVLCYATNPSIPQFDLYSCQAILIPAPGDLTT